MQMPDFIHEFKNFVLIGGSGSGKSVLSVNLAVQLAAEAGGPLHFFDLDQTKAMFRSRDFHPLLEQSGVLVHADKQFYDAPAISIGVTKFLRDPSCSVIIDVGGDDRGAAQIGQFSQVINTDDTLCLYIMNPYRPWSAKDSEIYETVSEILHMSHIEHYHVVANPNLGQETTEADVIDGFFMLQDAIKSRDGVYACCVNRLFYDAVKAKIDVPLISLEYFNKMYWD